MGEGISDSFCWREFAVAVHSNGGSPRAPGDEQKKSGLQRRIPGWVEMQGLGNRGSPPGPNSMVKTPESPLYVGTTMREQARAQTDEARGQRANVCVMLSKWRSLLVRDDVSSFTVSAVTGIPFRFVLAHDKARYEDSVPQFAECCGQRR